MSYTIRAVDKSLIEAMPEKINVEFEMFKPYEFDPAFFTPEGVAAAGHITIGDKKCYVIRPVEFGFVVKKVYTQDDSEPDPVLRAWGRYREYDIFQSSDNRLQSWIEKIVQGVGTPHVVANLEMSEECRVSIRCRTLGVRRSERFHPKITLWLSQEHRDTDRKTAMKPTRAFGVLFPELDHKQLMQINDLYLQEFAPREFTVHVSQEVDDFRRAYAGNQSATENIGTTRTRKHSAHSCMRYDFDHLPCHPATAYASGDFSIVFVTDQNGDIAGRCVVCTNSDSDRPQAGPIYGVSEQAIECIEQRLDTMGAEFGDDFSWVGARLKRISYGYDGFIGPYLDLTPQSLEDTGEHLVVSPNGAIDASVYSGLLNEHYATCYGCDSGLCEDDTYHSEHNGNCYCECCYYEEHIFCEYAEEDVHKDDTYTCWRLSHSGRHESLLVSQNEVECGEYFIMCSDGEYWHIDDVQYSEYDDEWISPDTIDEYFRSDWDGELYPNTMSRTTVDGEEVSSEEMDNDSGIWEKNDNNEWKQVQEEMEV